MEQRTHLPSPDFTSDPSPRPAGEPPFWLTDLCPRWCTGIHLSGEHAEDRAHWSNPREIPLLLERATHTPEGAETAQRLNVTVTQHWRETEPTIVLGVGDSGPEIALTLTEGRTLVHVLRQTLAAARVEPDPGAANPWRMLLADLR